MRKRTTHNAQRTTQHSINRGSECETLIGLYAVSAVLSFLGLFFVAFSLVAEPNLWRTILVIFFLALSAGNVRGLVGLARHRRLLKADPVRQREVAVPDPMMLKDFASLVMPGYLR